MTNALKRRSRAAGGREPRYLQRARGEPRQAGGDRAGLDLLDRRRHGVLFATCGASSTTGHLPPSDAVRVEELINYFPYDYPAPSTADVPFKPTVDASCRRPWKPGNKLVHIGIKGYDLDSAERPRANLVFLIDISGSMDAATTACRWSRTRCGCSSISCSPTTASRIVIYAGARASCSSRRGRRQGEDPRRDRQARARAARRPAREGIADAYALAEAQFRQERRQPRHPGHRRRLQRRHHRPERARRASSSASAKTGVFLSVLGFGVGNYNDAHDADAGAERQRQRRLHRHAQRGAQGAGRRGVARRSSPSPRT